MITEPYMTGDGSSTLYSPRFDEHYHSVHGAIQESRHVFLEAGLRPFLTRESAVRIFEMGFGTGLNTLLTLMVDPRPPIHYISIEAYPVPADQLPALNYGEQLGEAASSTFQSLHQAEWEKEMEIAPDFILQKRVTTLEDFRLEEAVDLIYYDAFAPSAQPELWTPEVMQRCFDMLRPGGVWVSYCAKGDVRRGLQAAGFEVERLPGPPGKRQMLRATRPM